MSSHEILYLCGKTDVSLGNGGVPPKGEASDLCWNPSSSLYLRQHKPPSAVAQCKARHVPGMNELEHCSFQIRKNL